MTLRRDDLSGDDNTPFLHFSDEASRREYEAEVEAMRAKIRPNIKHVVAPRANVVSHSHGLLKPGDVVSLEMLEGWPMRPLQRLENLVRIRMVIENHNYDPETAPSLDSEFGR